VELGVADGAAPVEGCEPEGESLLFGEVEAVEHLEVVGAVVEAVVVGSEVVCPECFAVFAWFVVAVVVAWADEGGDVDGLEDVVEEWVFVAVFVVVDLAVDEVAADDDEVWVEEVDFLDGLEEVVVVDVLEWMAWSAAVAADVEVGELDEGEVVFEGTYDVDGAGLGYIEVVSIEDRKGEIIEFYWESIWDGEVVVNSIFISTQVFPIRHV